MTETTIQQTSINLTEDAQDAKLDAQFINFMLDHGLSSQIFVYYNKRIQKYRICVDCKRAENDPNFTPILVIYCPMQLCSGKDKFIIADIPTQIQSYTTKIPNSFETIKNVKIHQYYSIDSYLFQKLEQLTKKPSTQISVDPKLVFTEPMDDFFRSEIAIQRVKTQIASPRDNCTIF